jgi:hypothetical protein
MGHAMIDLLVVHEDRHKLLGDSAILMPPEIQQLINDHLKMNPTLAEQILNKHTNINDDIQFDNQSYQTLKQILITKTYEKHTTQ